MRGWITRNMLDIRQTGAEKLVYNRYREREHTKANNIPYLYRATSFTLYCPSMTSLELLLPLPPLIISIGKVLSSFGMHSLLP
jgi:hypothetical protein